MASLECSQVRKGMVIVGADGQLYCVVARNLNPPGNSAPPLKLKLKSLKTGAVTETRLHLNDKVEQASLDTRDMQYIYQDGDGYVFMDAETCEQVTLPPELVGEQMGFLKENNQATLTYSDGKPVGIELPGTVELRVVGTDRAGPGATAARGKPATLETGLKLQVPPFINVGEVITVDTRTGEYLSRARETL